MKRTLFLLGLLILSQFVQAQNEPYKNANLTPTERAEDLVSRYIPVLNGTAIHLMRKILHSTIYGKLIFPLSKIF